MSKIYEDTEVQLKVDVDIDTQASDWERDLPTIEELANKISRSVFSITNFDNFTDHIEFSIILSDDSKVRTLNKEYRGADKPTNVLSFPAEDVTPKNFKNIPTYNGFIMIGDIVFAYQTLQYEAKNLGKSFEAHFCHLLVHGLLHLLGFDHETEKEADEMERIEVKVLSNFNIESPYQDNSIL